EVKRAKAAHPRVRMKLLFPSYQIYFPVPSPNTLKTRLLQGSLIGVLLLVWRLMTFQTLQ
ncbi:hypothetical protein ACFQ2Z_19935, partial [Paenibacillus timonensis]